MAITSWFALAVAALASTTAFDAGGDWGLGLPAGLLLFGLVGLVARKDPGSAIDRLTETVDRLAAGEYDVDVATDRDDAVGRLYEAVGELAETMRERERERLECERVREAIVQNAESAIYLKDRDGRYRFVNEAGAAFLGRDPDEVIGERDEELFDPGSAADIRAADRRVIETGAGITDERIRIVDGDERVFLDSRYPYRDEDGGVAGVTGVSQDITQRKERERRLETTSARLEALFENSPDMIDVLDRTGTILDANRQLCDELGYAEDGLVGGKIWELDQLFDAGDVLALLEELSVGERRKFEGRYRRRDGSAFPVEVHLIRLDLEDEDRYLAISRDITGRKERERELRRYKDYTDDVLDAIDDVFYVLGEDGTLRRWNESLSDVTGYTADEIADMHALDFFEQGERSRVAEAIAEVFETGEARIESKILTSDGDRIPYEFVAVALEDLNGNPVLTGIARDISERVEKERQLSRLMNNVPGMVYRCANEPDWPFEFVSEGSREISGYDPETLIDGDVNWNEEVISARHDELWKTVQGSVREREPFRVTYPIETADGERRWVKEQGRGVFDADDDLEALEGVIIDITERKRRERELERTTNLLEQAQRLTDAGGWEIDFRIDPPDVTWTDQLYRIHGIPPDEQIDIERSVELFHPDDRERVREINEAIRERGGSYEAELRLYDPDGKGRWVRTIGEAVREDGEVVMLRGSVQDITEQKERELALESLHEATQGLLGTDTEDAVAELVVDTAEDVLDVPGVGVYLLDTESNRLEPIAFTPGFVECCDGAPSAADRGSVLWDAFVTGSGTAFEGSGPFGEAADGGLVVPVGDHGVFVVTAPPPAVGDEVRRLIETLVATTEAALDRLEGEANLRERDTELEARNRRLRRQIRINDIIRRIDQSLIGAEDREDIEAAVCQRLVEAEDVAFAWIGAAGVRGTELVPRAWAGDEEGYLDAVELDEAGTDPAVTAAHTGTPTVVPNVVNWLKDEAWAKPALARGFHSVVSVPLSVDEYFYGVLTIYGSEPNAFGDLERTVFAELGENIANSITAVKTRQALHADAAVELTLRCDGSDALLARIAQETGVHVEYEGLATHSEDETRLFFSTDGDPAVVEAVLDDLVAVVDHRLVSESEGRALFEATVTGEVIASRLVRYDGSPRSIRAIETALEIVVDVPTTTEVREFVERLRERYPSVELVGRRDVQRDSHPKRKRVESLLEELTDRQREVLRTAYFAGFFEWPRASTGEDVAAILGVSQPTVNRHIRRSQQRLFEQLFDEASAAATDAVRSESG